MPESDAGSVVFVNAGSVWRKPCRKGLLGVWSLSMLAVFGGSRAGKGCSECGLCQCWRCLEEAVPESDAGSVVFVIAGGVCRKPCRKAMLGAAPLTQVAETLSLTATAVQTHPVWNRTLPLFRKARTGYGTVADTGSRHVDSTRSRHVTCRTGTRTPWWMTSTRPPRSLATVALREGNTWPD